MLAPGWHKSVFGWLYSIRSNEPTRNHFWPIKGEFYAGFVANLIMRVFHEPPMEFNHPFFSGMTPEYLNVLSDIAMLAKFDGNELVFREGDLADRFYLITEGKVAIETSVPHRGTISVDEIGAGDVLGWSWLYEPYTWHFNARTLSPTTAWFIYGTWLREKCEKDPALGYVVMQRVSQVLLHRLQGARRRLVYFAGRTSEFAESTSHG